MLSTVAMEVTCPIDPKLAAARSLRERPFRRSAVPTRQEMIRCSLDSAATFMCDTHPFSKRSASGLW